MWRFRIILGVFFGCLLTPAWMAQGADLLPTQSQERTILGVKGTRFTLNDEPAFLLGFSYYGALGASNQSVQTDLKDFRRLGFNWLRVWATWNAYGEDVSAVDWTGTIRANYMDRLQRLVAQCDRLGMVVDVTLNRHKGTTEGGGLVNFAAHQKAVVALVETLKPHRNWYLDLANERDVGDDRFVPCQELQQLRKVVYGIDPKRLVTASFGGHDLSQSDLRDVLVTVGVDFVCPHRPRHAKSAQETEIRTRKTLAMMATMGHTAPLHYQEPFRRGYGNWAPQTEDFLTDLRGAIAGGAAGWCFHNGGQRTAMDEQPRRSFDMRQKRLYEQLDAEEIRFVKTAALEINNLQ